MKALVVVDIAIKQPAVRSALRTWALSASLREQVTLAALAADLVRLRALELAALGKSRDVRGIARTSHGDVVIYRSSPVPTGIEPACILRDALRPGTTVVWDHSAAETAKVRVADAVGPIQVSVGFSANRQHRFDAIAAVAHDQRPAACA